MALLGAWFDTMMLFYFILHIPTTVLVDSQSVIPQEYFPPFLIEMLQWHIKTNGDFLVDTNPPWFVALVCGEVFLQLPFFFVATYAYIAKKNWIRIPALIYGVHTATTMIPIFGEILTVGNYQLAGIYAPYLVVPLLLATKMATTKTPFPPSSKPKRL
uniref:EXPERA domain-containing protein n=1 Tax=Chlamydomonas euryale TaxID=1486919 RepID=A0A7R9VI65_9CHLO